MTHTGVWGQDYHRTFPQAIHFAQLRAHETGRRFRVWRTRLEFVAGHPWVSEEVTTVRVSVG